MSKAVFLSIENPTPEQARMVSVASELLYAATPECDDVYGTIEEAIKSLVESLAERWSKTNGEAAIQYADELMNGLDRAKNRLINKIESEI